MPYISLFISLHLPHTSLISPYISTQVLTVQCPPGAMPGQQIPVQVPPPQMQAGPMGAPPVVRVTVSLGLGLGLGLP